MSGHVPSLEKGYACPAAGPAVLTAEVLLVLTHHRDCVVHRFWLKEKRKLLITPDYLLTAGD